MKKNKIKTHKELSAIASKAKEKGTVVGFTNGCFDILHVGHVKYLREARSECGILVVGVNSDQSVKRLKGDERPMNREEDRLEVLSALEFVDYVTLFDEDTPARLISEISPDILFKGGDWKEEEIAGSDHVRRTGGAVRIIPFVKGYSTTKLIKKIREEKNG